MAVVGTIVATELTPLIAPAAVWTGEQIAVVGGGILTALGIAAAEKAREDANEDPNQTPYVEPTPEYEPYAPTPVTHTGPDAAQNPWFAAFTEPAKSPTENSSANQLGEDLADMTTTTFGNTPMGSAASNALDTAKAAHNQVEKMENIRNDMNSKGIVDAFLGGQTAQAELEEETIKNTAEAPFKAAALAAKTAEDAVNAFTHPMGAINGVIGGFGEKLKTDLDGVGDTLNNTQSDLKTLSTLIDDNATLIDNNAKLIDNLVKYGKITHLIYLDRPKREKPTIEGLVYI